LEELDSHIEAMLPEPNRRSRLHSEAKDLKRDILTQQVGRRSTARLSL